MPEPLRDVALPGSGDARTVHARYFADWIAINRADELPPPPREFGQRLAMQERERDNILAALEACYASSKPEDYETGLRIVAAYWTHWYVRSEGSAMERWARSLLGGPGEQANPLTRAAAQLALALAVRERGARDECAAIVEAALSTLRAGPRDRNLAFAWHLRGLSLADLGQLDDAEAAYLEAEEVWSALEDRRNFSITRHNRAMVAADLGHLDKAEALVGEAMEAFIEHRSTYVAIGSATMATICRARKDLAGAAAALREASRFHHKVGYMRGWAQNERDLALCLFEQGNAEEATTLAEGALMDFQRVGDRHGEATAYAALARITGKSGYADSARRVMKRHSLPPVGELLENL
jgi:tetratricopeptide (TPR) repeat protein